MTEQSELIARMTALESRVAALDAESAITKVLHRLAVTLDYGDNAGWLDCFTSDAVFQMVEVGATERVVRVRHDGRDALAEFIPGHSHAPEHPHKHLVGDPVIEVDGAAATSTAYLTRLDKGENGPFLWSFGRYLDAFVREADGRWRVRERVIEVESRAVPVRASDIGSR